MNETELVAIGKAVKSKALTAASKKVDPGEYNVDIMVRVLGSFRKGEDYETTQTNTINWGLAFALALSKVNKETRAKIVETVLAAHGNGKESDEHKAMVGQIKDEIQPRLDEIKGKAKITATGKITTDLTTEVMGAGKIVKTA